MDVEGLEFLVVGAGLSGLTVARRLVDHGRKVAIIERRAWMGGLCSSYIDGETDIEVHRHGTHVLHSSNQKAISFLSRFCQLNHYRHRVFAHYERRTYPLPINLETINKFYGTDLDPKRAGHLVKIFASHACEKRRENEVRGRLPFAPQPTNFEEAAIAKMGWSLYAAFVEGYTKKHWGIDPQLLPTWLAERIPVRTNYNGDYFTDSWQGIPVGGYNRLFSSICKGITTDLGVDYQKATGLYPPGIKVVYTGSLDSYFDYRFGVLPWRGVEVVPETVGVGDYQGAAVINFPEQHIPQTRIHEFKHLHPESRVSSRKSVIAPEFASPQGEPAYPMAEDGELAKRYREAAMLEPNVYFCGRMATYRYLNMDQAVVEAIDLADSLCKKTI